LADQIAIFSNPKSKTLASCALLKPSPQNNSYQELLFIDESFEDVHSTSFSRVLIEAHSRNISFPQSCKELIKIEKPNLEFKKCL
jgi:hypothetical protein